MNSVFDLSKTGTEASGSCTVGPMRAAQHFVEQIANREARQTLYRIKIELSGALSASGQAGGTDKAVLLGLTGAASATLNPHVINATFRAICETGSVTLPWGKNIEFDWYQDLIFVDDSIAYRPAAIRLSAFFIKDETFSAVYGFTEEGMVAGSRH